MSDVARALAAIGSADKPLPLVVCCAPTHRAAAAVQVVQVLLAAQHNALHI